MRARARASHIPALAAVAALLAAVSGCTERRVLGEDRRVHGQVPLDSRRVLTTVVKSVEYSVSGFMVSRDETVHDTRFFILDPDSAPRPIRLKTRWDDFADPSPGHPGEVLLTRWKRLDWESDRFLETGLQTGKLPLDSAESEIYYDLEKGPAPGRYLVQGDRYNATRSTSEYYPFWYAYVSEPESYTLLGDGWDLGILDMTYHDGELWGLYRVDSLRIRFAPAHAESAGTVFALPDTLDEPHTRVRFAEAQKGPWIRFNCGRCQPPYYFYLHPGSPGADWVPADFFRPDSLLDSVWITTGQDGKTVYLHGDRFAGDSILFDLSPYFR